MPAAQLNSMLGCQIKVGIADHAKKNKCIPKVGFQNLPAT
jgi:hypothetical protein